MLDGDTRTAILRLRDQGHGCRTIASALGISRNAVKRVLAQGCAEVPNIERDNNSQACLDQIRQLHGQCKGNLVRVWEELEGQGISMAYSTLTALCRRHGIGAREKERHGRYEFAPAQEMQHDTSPHEVTVGEKRRKLQCAALVLCFSRMLFAQAYCTFNRFWCKTFLTDALVYFGGAAPRCMVDNTSVIIAHGTGKNAIPAPEMQAFSQRFGFDFVAHELGDVNRSARVERPFHYIEHNFYPGRSFTDLTDLNQQLKAWCDKVNNTFKPHLHAKPVELFQAERPLLVSLPIYVPEVYALHKRIVDIEGYVTVHTNRYSAPTDHIGHTVEVRESKDRVRIFDGHNLLAEHKRLDQGCQGRSTLAEHQRRRLWRDSRSSPLPPVPEEQTLMGATAQLKALVEALRAKYGNRATRSIRRLHRMFLDYPTDIVSSQVAEALDFGLLDLDRIERMILRSIAGEFFRLSPDAHSQQGEDHG